MKTCVLIPAYNCSASIGNLVLKIKSMGLDAVVVDDGSRDSTGDIARREGATVIEHKTNEGKGLSMRDGFGYILDKTPCDTVITMDGDGQHDPGEIKKFLKKAAAGTEGMIVGNRMGSSRSMPFLRYLTNRFMSFLLSVLCGQRIEDSQCGFRLIKRACLQSIKIDSKYYDVESEMLVRASRKSFRIASIPVKAIYKGEVSRINPLLDTVRFMGLLARLYLGRKANDGV